MQIHGLSPVNPPSAAGAQAAPTPATVPLAHALTSSRERATPGRASDACASRHHASPSVQKHVKLIAAVPQGHEGDRRQARAVAGETMRALVDAGLYRPGEISCETLTVAGRDHASLERALTQTLKGWMDRVDSSEYERLIFILAGSDHGLAPVLGDVPSDDVVITAFTGHKLTQDIKTARRLPAIMALPVSAVTEEERTHLAARTNLILVPGVAHDVTEASIQQAARDYAGKGYKPIPKVDGDTVSILLGGDVVDEDPETGVRTLRRLTPDDARRQASDIARLELEGRRRCHFVIVSSPRTGKYGPDGAEVNPNPHRTGTRDEVTRAFAETLSAYPNAQVDVFDFQYAESPSAYGPLLHAYRSAGGPTGRIHVPGDSVSMVSEVASVLPGAMVIDETASMDANHRRAAEAIAAHGGIAMLRRDGTLQPGRGEHASPPEPAAKRIADAIVAYISASAPAASTDAAAQGSPARRISG